MVKIFTLFIIMRRAFTMQWKIQITLVFKLHDLTKLLKEDTKILKFNQYQKSDKVPFIVYAYLECIIENIDGCKNNPENSSTTKASEHIPSGFSIPTIS